METLINLGAARVAKTTSDAHDFQTKAFSEMRGEKSDECTSSVLKQRDVSVKWLRSWIWLKSSQSKVHEAGDVHMNADALTKTEGDRVSEKGKEARSRTTFIGHCFWCGAHGHEKSDCRKKAAGRPRTARSPTISGRRAARAVKELRPLRSGQILMRKQCVAPWVPSAEMKSTASKIGKLLEKIQEQAIRQWKPNKSGGFSAKAVDAEMGQRIDLTIGSGCASLCITSGCCICRWDAREKSRSWRINTLLQTLRGSAS